MVIIAVLLPMSKTEFVAYEDKYIASVASAAHVLLEKVKILSIDEMSTRSVRQISGRLLLATKIRVKTSVLIEIGRPTNVDQFLLNSNLNKNGLPSGQIEDTVQDTNPASIKTTTAVSVQPEPGCAAGELSLFFILLSHTHPFTHSPTQAHSLTVEY